MIGVRENRISFALGFGFKILRKTCLSVGGRAICKVECVD